MENSSVIEFNELVRQFINNQHAIDCETNNIENSRKTIEDLKNNNIEIKNSLYLGLNDIRTVISNELGDFIIMLNGKDIEIVNCTILK